MHRLILIILSLLFLQTDGYSAELKFLFTDDQEVKSEKIEDLIKDDKDISKNLWFSSPPTRVELLTYSLDQYFKKEFNDYWSWYEGELKKHFEKKRYLSISNDPSVGFVKEKDIFVARVNISGLGKPTKPMREICDSIISQVSTWFKGDGYYYQNTILRPFISGSYDDPEILNIVELFKNNIIVIVSLISSYSNEQIKNKDTYYQFDCYKNPHEKNIHYSKRTF